MGVSCNIDWQSGWWQWREWEDGGKKCDRLDLQLDLVVDVGLENVQGEEEEEVKSDAQDGQDPWIDDSGSSQDNDYTKQVF